jgi:hypothetical protein
MSLILDALRKLEREKDARAPGILVVGSVPWGETSRARRVALAGVAVAALLLAVAFGWLLRPTAAPPAAQEPPATTTHTLPTRSAPTPVPPAATPPLSWASPAPPPPPAIRLDRPAARQATPAPQDTAPAPPSAAAASEPVPADVPAPDEPAPDRISVSPAPPSGRPPVALKPDELRLTAISRRDGRPVALINDRLVFEGDSFEGVRVIRIGEAEVEVEVRGERRVLRF